MNTILKSLILAVTLTFFAPVVAHAAVNCKATEDQFYKDSAQLKPQYFVATDKARVLIVSLINKSRAEANQAPFDVDKLTIGVFSVNGQVMIGTVMFKHGCLVEGTVKAFPADQFITFLESVGLSIEDFKPQVGA